MGTLKSNIIEPATGTTLTLGASGDSVTVSSDSIKANTFKDAGGNTLFTSNGTGTLSSINSAFVGDGPVLLSTSAGTGVTEIAITSNIDTTYDEYMFVVTNFNPATDDYHLFFQCSTNGGSSYGVTLTSTMFLVTHRLDDGGDSFGYNTGGDLAQSTDYQYLMYGIANGASDNSSGILNLFGPGGTAYVKNWYARFGGAKMTASGPAEFVERHSSGYFNTTSAINAISFKSYSGSAFDATVQMYGIK